MTTKWATAPVCARASPAGYRVRLNNATILALPSCDGLWLVTSSVGAMLRQGRRDSVGQALARYAGGYQPAGALGASLSPRQRDGASAYRGFAFDDRCGCFRYVSSRQPLR